MRLIEISSFKLFCYKFVSHKMFCCKNFCHKNVARKAKKFPAWGFPRAGKKKKRAGCGGWPCRTPPHCTRRWAAWPPATPPPPMAAAAAACARPCGSADRHRQARPFFFTFKFFFFVILSIFFCFLSPLLRFGFVFAFFLKKFVVQILCYCFLLFF